MLNCLQISGNTLLLQKVFSSFHIIWQTCAYTITRSFHNYFDFLLRLIIDQIGLFPTTQLPTLDCPHGWIPLFAKELIRTKVTKYTNDEYELFTIRAISDPLEHLVTSTSILLCFATLKNFLSDEFSAGFDSVVVYGVALRT